ncbi:MAG: di-heme-cytochrome C peroxidase, partial [Pseudomonadota bacterium]
MINKASWSRRWLLPTLIVLAVIIALIFVIGKIRHSLEYADDDPDRGATISGMDQPDAMGDVYTKVVYPADQGWNAAESLWFYNTTQGSDMLPYDFFLHLEQPDSETLFRDAANINDYRYLVQKATYSNPDGLPLGFVKDTYQGRHYVGMTCAACHTGQVNYQGTAIRIDGGIPMADMVGFLEGLAESLHVTSRDEAKFERFASQVLAGDDYSDREQVREDLKAYALRLTLYNSINRSYNGSHRINYGHGRLDAFGRIFNRTVEHLLTKEQLRELIRNMPGILPGQAEQIVADTKELLTAANREAIMRKIFTTLQQNGKSRFGALRIIVKHLHHTLYNPPNAPVSYPVIWDIPQHDYVQWNGITANAGPGSLGRNVGEVIGVFGTLDWYLDDECDLASRITGQCSLFGTPTKNQLIRFKTSVDKHNLVKMEQQLTTLRSPSWEDTNLQGILPELGPQQVAAGRELYEQYCVACHHDIDRDDPYRKVVAYMT